MDYKRVAPMRNYNASNNTRKCGKCKHWLDLSQFSERVRIPSPTTKDPRKLVPTLYYRECCKNCSISTVRIDKYCGPEAKKRLHREDPRKVMLIQAKIRAKRKGIPFNIGHSDIVIPELCPLIGIPIRVSNKNASPGSPSLDRLIPDKGYTKGNVWVVSHKANWAKSNLSLEELELLTRNLRRVLYKEEELLES